MKTQLLILALTFFGLSGVSQTNKEFLFVGKVNCHTKSNYLMATQKAYKIHYINTLINQSTYLIDISLTQTGYPFLAEISARFYWDTTFKLYYITSTLQEDGSFNRGDTTYPPSTLILDSLFSKLVENGLFSLPIISTDSIKKSWKAQYISKKGVFGENTISVADGDEYVITFKLNKCYGQYIFDNPSTYAKFYLDNSIFKRQDEICKLIMSGYK